MTEMKLWFFKWGYPENIVYQELGKVEFHKLLENIGRMFHSDQDQEVKRVFTSGPMAWFPSAWKIRSYLVQAKLHRLE